MIIRTITSVDKTENNVESITTLVGPDWGPFTLAECVAWAKEPDHQFVVRGAISTLEVMVVPSKTEPGREILQTRMDRTMVDTLLTLKPIVKLESLFGGSQSIF
ncbi:MAG: hypothetical protein JWO78_2493 [Micavibrio sp.]|nr:hypothetical protein [Micavibrio sp.]